MNKDRRKTTQFLSELLIHTRLNGPAKYWAKEVSLDYGHGKGIEKRVDFLQFEPVNQKGIDGIEKGVFTCYEVKSCKADFQSGCGMNFVGEKNYLVMPMFLYKQVINELPANVGVLVAVPEGRDPYDEFTDPTPLDAPNISWKLHTIFHAQALPRTKSMTELLFCMLRSGK